jgi:uncharacterized membrane protein YedE/YeeE
MGVKLFVVCGVALYLGQGAALSLHLISTAHDNTVRAHEHHAIVDIDPGVPFDAIIIIHVRSSSSVSQFPAETGIQMVLQAFLWGVSFPIGMVLGLSKWANTSHDPVDLQLI